MNGLTNQRKVFNVFLILYTTILFYGQTFCISGDINIEWVLHEFHSQLVHIFYGHAFHIFGDTNIEWVLHGFSSQLVDINSASSISLCCLLWGVGFTSRIKSNPDTCSDIPLSHWAHTRGAAQTLHIAANNWLYRSTGDPCTNLSSCAFLTISITNTWAHCSIRRLLGATRKNVLLNVPRLRMCWRFILQVYLQADVLSKVDGANLLDLRHSRVCWSIEWTFHAISVYLYMCVFVSFCQVAKWGVYVRESYRQMGTDHAAILKTLQEWSVWVYIVITLALKYEPSDYRCMVWKHWYCDTWRCSGAWVY